MIGYLEEGLPKYDVADKSDEYLAKLDSDEENFESTLFKAIVSVVECSLVNQADLAKQCFDFVQSKTDLSEKVKAFD